ncbi:MAG TPA: class II aldolase/adducin family protein [Acidocella sp.]|jgi:L-fuculose-phosphate aldolase|uniref:class II aldolase/adducin family protein n=1 Tax=Acidocella sp. TaxID=50710 RepID=UPI002B58E8F2|nr:class II aldolase/adducin family protein [Acidocella sp.]HVE23433.1 class II aldolase/adducin family protein [Acidocella sp.]
MDDRKTLIAAAQKMAALGLAQGTSGNLSLRTADGILITPSAVPYDTLMPEMIPLLLTGGDYGAYRGRYRPSSEWRFHLDILAARPELGAVVHHHAPYTTALSMARKEIPACHYMIARFGGAPVRCAPYALFGTAELSANVLAALEGRTACLMANHGGLAVGKDVESALAAANELEALAEQYVLSLAAGGPVLLSDAEVQAALEQFGAVYGPNVPKQEEG